ncbi:hypothetical protein LTS18_004029, partial [Coniosporium uncinatum]
ITTAVLLLGRTAFFALGNSNAISSIDLSNAYNGVSSYNAVAVGILVFVGNWAGPLWWSFAGLHMLFAHKSGDEQGSGSKGADGKKKASEWVVAERRALAASSGQSKKDDSHGGLMWRQHVSLLTLFTAGSTLAVMLACTALRTHLFIWTVFSPKYLFAGAWVLHHLLVDVTVGGLVWLAAGWT